MFGHSHSNCLESAVGLKFFGRRQISGYTSAVQAHGDSIAIFNRCSRQHQWATYRCPYSAKLADDAKSFSDKQSTSYVGTI